MMNKIGRTLAILGATVAIVTIATYGAWRYAYGRSRSALQQAKMSFEQDISQHVPLGSDQNIATKFLDSRGMIHTELGQPPSDASWYAGASGSIEARGSEIKTVLYRCAIHVELKFDGTGRLLGYRDSMPCTGSW